MEPFDCVRLGMDRTFEREEWNFLRIMRLPGVDERTKAGALARIKIVQQLKLQMVADIKAVKEENQ